MLSSKIWNALAPIALQNSKYTGMKNKEIGKKQLVRIDVSASFTD